MNFILETGVGFWNPVMFLVGFSILLLITYLIWSRGEKGCKKGVQGEAFFSGDVSPRERIQANNLYWGFSEALKGYYKKVGDMHTGIVNDYVAWFIALIAIILVLINL